MRLMLDDDFEIDDYEERELGNNRCKNYSICVFKGILIVFIHRS